MSIRISKYLSSGGVCSRRDAEKLIIEKKIKINNQICIHPSHKVSDLDIIKVDNKIVKKSNSVQVWRLYKPIKYICSTKDNLDRKKIFDLLPKKEVASTRKELEKLRMHLNGIKDMPRTPDVMIVVDQRRELTAIKEKPVIDSFYILLIRNLFI